MAFAKGRHPGAVWRKTDLQIHTPRDAGWSGSPALAGGDNAKEAARESWADHFVAECLKRELAAIAITDHHDIVLYPYIQRAIERSQAAREVLWLFPGMEITCDDSVQCLTLFDQGTPPDVLRRLFGLMPKVAEPSADLDRAPQAILCGKDIKDFLGATFDDASFRGKSIVLPHASEGGHKDILRRGFHSRFAELEVDGVYNEKAFAALDDVTRKKIYGETKEWGDRRHGIITTGDNRNADFAKLGVNACWMRLGEPTAEAIRQAVLADEARILYVPPTIPAQRVLELRVSSSLTGPQFVLVFNDGFNSLIGGRGSGKSAILEYLRFGLGRSTLDASDDPSSERERDLITSTLPNGYVEVDLERDGVKETWRRTLDHQSYIAIRSATGETIEIPVATARERFRARAFSQKQLSTLVRRPETADEQITGIAAAESVDLRRQRQQQIEIAEREIAGAFQRVVQGWAAEAAYTRAVATTEDLKKRVEAIRERLEQGGLSPEQQAVLDQQPIYARTENQFQTSDRAIAQKLISINQIAELALEGWANAIDLPPVAEAKNILGNANAKIVTAREELRIGLETAKAELTTKHTAFKLLHEEFKVKYEAASAAQQHLGSLLADYRRLTAELEQAEKQQQTADEERVKYAKAEETLAETRNALVSELTELRKILIEAAARVDDMSKGTLRGRVEEEAIPERFVEALIDLTEKCGIRELDARCKARVEEAHKDGGVEWEKLIQQLLSVRKAVVQAGEGAELDPELLAGIRSSLGWELTNNQAKLILGRLDDGRLGRLLSVWASPFVRFEYKDRGTYMPFERASPGQQASALLTLLLNQEAGTLIIDQPEDDLDNRVIMMIAKLLQTTKRRRQLIFATHNPNFVVNGDADKIVCLAPNVEPAAPNGVPAAQIEIDTDGAIETPSVRKAITDTMEGGREAFELRSRKYAFEPIIVPETKAGGESV
ncbi:MAG: AAA family ATPase [Proteobacteria bacterium]|nr:AAA family ATPase [Pseudomonadota bacterium]